MQNCNSKFKIKVWTKFVLWTISIGIILRFIITVLIKKEPFYELEDLFIISNPILRYIFTLFKVAISGLVIGTLLFGIWYIFIGRRKK